MIFRGFLLCAFPLNEHYDPRGLDVSQETGRVALSFRVQEARLEERDSLEKATGRLLLPQNASLAQRNPVPLGRLSIVPQSRSVTRRLTAGFNQDPPRIALIAPRSGPLGLDKGADR